MNWIYKIEKLLMKSITPEKLKKKEIYVAPEVIPLFEIHSKLIYPHLEDCHLINERNIALSKPSLFIKDERALILGHNFELYNILKMTDATDEILKHKMLYSEISAEFFRFDLAFYELIYSISRYHKLVNLEHVYNELRISLSLEICQELFGKNNFGIATFCSLINLPERTYYNRIETN
ncbi:hypothetical protein [Psychrobacter sp. ASPA161_9]|uniref:hypothetical protein n=1 Tax=Psychrobacter sp. ASPA161_9 TaxID=3160961 RepID=UPI003F7E05B2